MLEIGIETSVLIDIRSGRKSIEGRLGKPKFLKVKEGDVLRLREDVWKGGEIIESLLTDVYIKITQVLYFESISEMLETLDYKAVLPSALNVEDGIEMYREFYSVEDEIEYGVVAMLFELV